MGKKKLLMIGGGKSVHTYNLLALVKDYFDDYLLITHYHNPQQSDVNVRIVDYTFSNPINIICAPIKINKIIKQYRPDFILILQVDTGAFCTLLANTRNIPSLVIGMGSDILLTPYKGFLYKLMTKYVLHKGKYFNTGAQYVANKMNELANKDLGVIVANFGFESCIKPSNKQNIIYSNRLHKPLYRIPDILKAFARFVENDKRKDWKLVVGASGDEENLKVLARELAIEDKLEFVGWLEKERNNYYYSISKVWISIPQSDCTPISLMEAMASGCIPILSDLPSMREWVDDGDNGIIVSDLNENFIERAMDLDYQSLKQKNLILMQEKGSKESNRAKFYSIFDKEFKR